MIDSRAIRDRLLPPGGPPDVRGIRRFAMEQMKLALRRGDGRAARGWRQLGVRALRVLRFAARIKAGRARGRSHCPHPLFSDAPEIVREAPTIASAPEPDRRRTFREGRRRC